MPQRPLVVLLELPVQEERLVPWEQQVPVVPLVAAEVSKRGRGH